MVAVRADKPRRSAGARDMLLSLGVIFAFIALGWPAFVNRETQTVRAIDFHEALAQARLTTTYPLLSPEELPQGWRATSAYLDKAPASGFHIGLVTPTDQYAALEQTNAAPADALRTVLGDGSVPGETAAIGGAQWELRETAHKQHVLVCTTNGVTVIVTGTAGWPDLQTLAASLR